MRDSDAAAAWGSGPPECPSLPLASIPGHLLGRCPAWGSTFCISLLIITHDELTQSGRFSFAFNLHIFIYCAGLPPAPITTTRWIGREVALGLGFASHSQSQDFTAGPPPRWSQCPRPGRRFFIERLNLLSPSHTHCQELSHFRSHSPLPCSHSPQPNDSQEDRNVHCPRCAAAEGLGDPHSGSS